MINDLTSSLALKFRAGWTCLKLRGVPGAASLQLFQTLSGSMLLYMFFSPSGGPLARLDIGGSNPLSRSLAQRGAVRVLRGVAAVVGSVWKELVGFQAFFFGTVGAVGLRSKQFNQHN